MGKRLLITLLLMVPALTWAQEETKPASAGLAFGLFAHSFGFGFDVQYMVLRGDWDYSFGVSMSSYKNPKELKIKSAYSDQAGKDYVYDKLNYCYVIAPSFGLSRKLISRNIFNRVGLRGSISGGPLIALLKPYYVDIAIPFNGNQAYVETERYDYNKHNYSNIYGVGDYFLGMNELSVVPGARVKLATMVDLSSGTAYIRGIELGMFADIYAKKLPLFGFTANRQTFVGGSVEILIGNTW
ncbi:MAG TPA: hypothetical protein VHS96_15330 [Bacteroidia bacterium]|nr:hypothetical protein [Bacteroidia bacterium]